MKAIVRYGEVIKGIDYPYLPVWIGYENMVMFFLFSLN